MSFGDYLREFQPIVYQTFSSAIKQNKLSHAYLIKGNEGAPLLECAKYLAKSLICEDGDPLACEECMSCIRFDEGNYADFILLDGSKQTIKVSDIEDLQSFFKKTSSERAGKMIYIIHLLENSNRESLNAILKFLEEPEDNVFAFITTYNEERLLPTILSRTQHLKLLPLPLNDVIMQANAKGISMDDCEILSNFYSNVDSLVNVASSKDYQQIKDLVFDVLETLNESRGEMLFYMESTIIPKIKDKIAAKLFLDLLSLAFKDILNCSVRLPITLKAQRKLIESLSTKIKNIEQCYLEIMFCRSQIDLNVNVGLILEHIAITIYKGGK